MSDIELPPSIFGPQPDPDCEGQHQLCSDCWEWNQDRIVALEAAVAEMKDRAKPWRDERIAELEGVRNGLFHEVAALKAEVEEWRAGAIVPGDDA